MKLFPSDQLRRRDPVVSLAAMTKTFLAETKLVPDAIVSTVPGFVDVDGDRVIFAANLPELNNLRLASEWAKLMGIPVVLERDAVLSLIGEHLAGAARERIQCWAFSSEPGLGLRFLNAADPFAALAGPSK